VRQAVHLYGVHAQVYCPSEIVECQGYVVAITIPVTKIIKATTYRIKMILEIRIEIRMVFLKLNFMPKLSLEMLGRGFAASLQFHRFKANLRW
jgi:hypothetical protein